MQNKAINVSIRFKKTTIRAILSIIVFFITYVLLMLIAIGLTILFGFIGITIIVAKPAFITLMLGVGLLSMGILILIFLVKFIFKKHVVNRSHLTPLSKEQNPAFFEFVTEIVSEVKTGFPKNIYLSSDVNASVFYDSSFWSMILPVKKNLEIGIGLVNAVSVVEFKAILAHEFGHFSQRSMKVGSYVYNVNQIIYNMLYDNESYNLLATKWGSISGYFAFFVAWAVKIIQGIKWILTKVYNLVNSSYMSLSREMEFHADEVAANVVGSKPLITSLLRLDLANRSYNTVLDYYENKIADSVKTENIYPQQQYVMNLLAKESKLTIENGLPQVSINQLSRYNKSKLVIKNQWASHPSTEDRVLALEVLDIEKETENVNPASTLFSDIDSLQAEVTQKLFSAVTYSAPVVNNRNEQFIEEYTMQFKANSFPVIFNNYYDNKNPGVIETGPVSDPNQYKSLTTDLLFGNSKVDEVYTYIALENDINTLRQILNGEIKVKTFDYAGAKYQVKDCPSLILQMEKELKKIKHLIDKNDICIYNCFMLSAAAQGKQTELQQLYQDYYKLDKEYDDKLAVYIKMINESYFVNQTNAFNTIEQNLTKLAVTEKEFKKHVETMVTDKLYYVMFTPEIEDAFKNYLSKNWIYFQASTYNDDALAVLFTCINYFQQVLAKAYFNAKKVLLEYKATIVAADSMLKI